MKTLIAFYDLAVGPVSYDFVVFLVKAEMQRKVNGCDSLHVVIVPYEHGVDGMFRDKLHLYTADEMHWRLWNICIPACRLLGASVTLAISREQGFALLRTFDGLVHTWPEHFQHQTLKHRHHLIGDIINWSANQRVPTLSASRYARQKVKQHFASLGKPVVTMTVRNTYENGRNSVLPDWQEAAAHIHSKGYHVLFIQDTSKALAGGFGYGELNLDLRMACYQEAALNLQANNGAASLCWFSDKPYRMFGASAPGSEAEWDGLFVKQGLPLDKTWPWAHPWQKLVYGEVTADQIIGEFESWAG